MTNGRKRTPPGRLARGCVHLEEDFDVEGDCGTGAFQPQPDGVRVRVRGGHQANLGDGVKTGCETLNVTEC